MKSILYISYFHDPFTHVTGAGQRSNLLLRACMQGAEVDFVAFRKMESNIEGVNVMYSEDHDSPSLFHGLSRKQKLHSLAKPWDLQRIFNVEKDKEQVIDSLVAKKNYDYIVIRYLPDALRIGLMKYADRLVLDIDDHPKDVIRDFGKKTKSAFNRLYFNTIALFAQKGVKAIVEKVHTAFFSNPQDTVGSRGIYLPNVPFYEMPSEFVDFATTTPRVLFVGTLDYKPNYLGICHFLDSVWPLVKKAVSNAELHIVGATCSQQSLDVVKNDWETNEDVEVLGFVEDLSEEYSQCRATIVPIYSGAGTCIKTIESMQQRRVCVSTPFGIRGIRDLLKPGSDVLVADNDKQFAEHIVKAITTPALNRTISENAHGFVSQHFTKQAFYNIVAKELF